MRGWAGVLGLWVSAACTSPNPAYEGSGGPPTTDPSGSASTGPISADGSGPGTSADETGNNETGADDSSSDGGPAVYDRCQAQLYGVSQFQGLFLIDVEAQALTQVANTPPSIALATHPETGEIWVSPAANPAQLLLLDPGTFSVVGMQGLPPGSTTPTMPWPLFSRAGFDDQANLWLGGYETDYFIRYQPGAPAIDEWQLLGFPDGGDMIMLAESEALVLTHTPPARLVTFGDSETVATMVPVQGVPQGVLLTGMALVDNDPWASAGLTLDSPDSVLLHLEDVGETYQVVDSFHVDVRIDDLAPVVTAPADCR